MRTQIGATETAHKGKRCDHNGEDESRLCAGEGWWFVVHVQMVAGADCFIQRLAIELRL